MEAAWRILLPAHIVIDGLEVDAGLAVVVHKGTDQHPIAESIKKSPSESRGGQPA